jgi:hypothetical protein
LLQNFAWCWLVFNLSVVYHPSLQGPSLALKSSQSIYVLGRLRGSDNVEMSPLLSLIFHLSFDHPCMSPLTVGFYSWGDKSFVVFMSIIISAVMWLSLV